MILSDIGKIAEESWKRIETFHKDVELDYYIIMPNHIHGIIVINNVRSANSESSKDRTKMELSKLVQQFKRAVTIRIKSINNKTEFKWQRSFYDRIIRNEQELYNIRKYIEQNPLKWSLESDIINLDI